MFGMVGSGGRVPYLIEYGNVWYSTRVDASVQVIVILFLIVIVVCEYGLVP
jgi:ABC-type methionine transport system permease subunit